MIIDLSQTWTVDDIEFPDQEAAFSAARKWATEQDVSKEVFCQHAPSGTIKGWRVRPGEQSERTARKLPEDTPRRWDAPPEPGPEVTRVVDRYGQAFARHDGGWCYVGPQLAHTHRSWSDLFFRNAPLTDATPTDPNGATS